MQAAALRHRRPCVPCRRRLSTLLQASPVEKGAAGTLFGSWRRSSTRLLAAGWAKSINPLLRHEVEGVHRLGSCGYQTGLFGASAGRATYTIRFPLTKSQQNVTGCLCFRYFARCTPYSARAPRAQRAQRLRARAAGKDESFISRELDFSSLFQFNPFFVRFGHYATSFHQIWGKACIFLKGNSGQTSILSTDRPKSTSN